MKELQTEILIVGGGTGGVAAALAALRVGRRVIMTEVTDWIGGQLTAQAVPPDEHPWIEATGCTRSYRQLREGIRRYYREYYPLTLAAQRDPLLNPGAGTVSAICHEPRVSLAVLQGMLAPFVSGGQLTILLEHRPVAAESQGDRVLAVTLEDARTGDQTIIHAAYILDATEKGDLLELAGIEHMIGAESQAETGEPNALPGGPDPLDQQAISWCFALDYLPGENHVIDRPEDYGFWSSYQAPFWPGPHLGWCDPLPHSLEPHRRGIFFNESPDDGRDDFTLWVFRRILFAGHYPEGTFRSDITLVNWPQLDYWLGPVIGVSPDEQRRHERGAAQLAYSLLYWMQTDAPRHDGSGYGYPGLRLRGDVVGTTHGLAKHLYIREARRIQAEFTVCEQHIGVKARGLGSTSGAAVFADSVGVGSYRIDLHPSTALRSYLDLDTFPFQIPLGALIPKRVENVLPACKNIGSTHITNGCYRLHPVEWNIGEAAGALAAHCIEQGLTPRQVRNQEPLLHDFQMRLRNQLGFVLEWPHRFARAAFTI
jgi:hypothetical protein